MAYRRLADRKAEEERSRLDREWMTLPEAVSSVKESNPEKITPDHRSTINQIADAIKDEQLRARWRDEASLRGDVGPILRTPDLPLFSIGRWRTRIAAGGKVPWGKGRHRELLLHRADVARLFCPPRRAGKGRTGPKPVERERVEQAMRDDLNSGEITPEELNAEKQEALAKRYDTKRGTATNARRNVLPEFLDGKGAQLRQTPTGNK